MRGSSWQGPLIFHYEELCHMTALKSKEAGKLGPQPGSSSQWQFFTFFFLWAVSWLCHRKYGHREHNPKKNSLKVRQEARIESETRSVRYLQYPVCTSPAVAVVISRVSRNSRYLSSQNREGLDWEYQSFSPFPTHFSWRTINFLLLIQSHI